MNQLAIAISLVRVDVRWRFLKIMYSVFALAVLVLLLWFSHVRVPRLAQISVFETFFVTFLFSQISSLPRIGFLYQMGLPISTRTMFLTTLLLNGAAIWLPAILVTIVLFSHGYTRAISPLAFVGLWMTGSSVLWLGWPGRQSAPGLARVAVSVIQIAFLFLSFLHRISPEIAITLFITSVVTSVSAFLRLPLIFTSDSESQGTSVSSVSLGSENAWFTLARILFPPVTLLLICPGLLQQNFNWALQGFWIFLIYSIIRSGDPLLLSLPLSQLHLIYARLVCAFLIEMLLACYVDIFSRLEHKHSGPHLVPTLLAVTIALALVASMKSLSWRSTPPWLKRPLLALFCILAIGIFSLPFFGDLMQQIACFSPSLIVPPASLVSALLLLLITIQTRNSDQLAMSVPSTSGFEVFNRPQAPKLI